MSIIVSKIEPYNDEGFLAYDQNNAPHYFKYNNIPDWLMPYYIDFYGKWHHKQAVIKQFEQQLDTTICTHGLKKIIDSEKKDFVIIDARAEVDFKKGHIPGAVNLPDIDLDNLGDTETLKALTSTGFNYVYCYNITCLKSRKVCIALSKLGYLAKDVLGGFDAWTQRGYPIEKS